MAKAKKKSKPIVPVSSHHQHHQVQQQQQGVKKKTKTKAKNKEATNNTDFDLSNQNAAVSGRNRRRLNNDTATDATAHPKPQLVCKSIVDRQAAKAIQALLDADSGQGKGATLKSLTLAAHIEAKKATYAVTCQVLKHLPILKQVLRKSNLMQQPRMEQMSDCTAYVLLYELLIGEGLHQLGVSERLVLKYKDKLQQTLSSLLAAEKAQTVSELQARYEASIPAVPDHPRWVRVNTLKADVQQVLQQLQAQFPGTRQDAHVPELLRCPPSTSLYNHPLVADGSVVMQGKASCMPAAVLDPCPGWHVVDCCAAPGNKTTHAAARMKGKGRVDAFDKDGRRLQRLKDNASITGATIIHAHQQDFLSIDTNDEQWAQVQGVILDPSCSGSGTIVGRQDHLLPSWATKAAALQRIRQMHAQLSLQQPQALSLPVATDGPQTAQNKKAKTKAKSKAPSQASSHDDVDQDVSHKASGGPSTQGVDHEDAVEASQEKDADMDRVIQLAKFQVTALKHALTFPALQRLVYSTCSIHPEENELVVQEVLPYAQSLGFQLKEALPSWTRRGLPLFPGCENLIRTDPFEDETDGFFVALFERAGTAASAQQGSVSQDAAGHTAQEQPSKPHNKKRRK